jgi:hypothetical protein
MRRCLLVMSIVMADVALSGCAATDEPDPLDPGSFSRASMGSNAGAGTVRCSADEAGNLRVRAPADARVSIPRDARGDDATVEIDYATADAYDHQMPRPQRPASRSLGFIGDAPLTQGSSYGNRYSYGSHDNLVSPRFSRW